MRCTIHRIDYGRTSRYFSTLSKYTDFPWGLGLKCQPADRRPVSQVRLNSPQGGSHVTSRHAQLKSRRQRVKKSGPRDWSVSNHNHLHTRTICMLKRAVTVTDNRSASINELQAQTREKIPNGEPQAQRAAQQTQHLSRAPMCSSDEDSNRVI